MGNTSSKQPDVGVKGNVVVKGNEEVVNEKSGFQKTKAFLVTAAIDFGTTYTGWAFSFRDAYLKDPTDVQTKHWNSCPLVTSGKAPSSIFIQDESVAFGFDAEDKYETMVTDNLNQGYLFFKHFKMILHEKGVQRNTKLQDINGKELPALEVFSTCIRVLKEDVMTTVMQQRTGILDSDIFWVLTVPAIWNDAARQFMREAAISAGISGDNFTIALEPECASIYCYHQTLNRDKTLAQFPEGTTFLVVDGGGGTVDIIAHEIGNNGRLKEIARPVGNDNGGNRINEAFMRYMDKLFGKEQMTRVRENGEDILDLSREFEAKKRNYQRDVDFINIKVPLTLLDEPRPQDESAFFHRDKLKIKTSKIEAFFKETQTQLLSSVHEILNECHINPDYILFVGGMAESKIIQQTLESAYPGKMIIPKDAGLAVLKGAVIYGHDTSVIKQRVCRYTYGIATTHRHTDTCKHRVGRREEDADGIMRCYDLFKIHVRVGDVVIGDQCQEEMVLTPVYDTQSGLTFEVYATEKNTPELVTDDGCEKIGHLPVSITRRGRDKKFGISMMFGGTEIEVKCEEKATGKITKTRINFLGLNKEKGLSPLNHS